MHGISYLFFFFSFIQYGLILLFLFLAAYSPFVIICVWLLAFDQNVHTFESSKREAAQKKTYQNKTSIINRLWGLLRIISVYAYELQYTLYRSFGSFWISQMNVQEKYMKER